MLTIRDENSKDYQQVELITDAAFQGKPYSAGNEATIPQKLRDLNALTFALVAEYKGDIVAHIAISTVQINGKNNSVFAIGPLSVSPKFQGKGIGSKLVKIALNRLQKSGAICCVLVGDPNFYGRLGFNVEADLTYQGAPAEYFQSVHFQNTKLLGEVTFQPAFY